MKYEDAVKQLEKLVSELENGNTELDEAIKKYSEAVKLAAYCTECLNSAKQKITQVRTDTGDENDE